MNLEDENHKSIVRAMVEQRMESLASAAYRAVPDNLKAAIARKVAHECQELCSIGVNSVLRQSSVDALASFSPQKFVEELVSVAPTFYAIVCVLQLALTKQV